MIATVGALLEKAAWDLAADRDVAEARREAQVLLGFALGVTRAWVTTHPDQMADSDTAGRFQSLVALRVGGHPVAYLLGVKEFYGLPLRVTPDVLIPRPETEELVEAALERLPQGEARQVLDLGTGSGCIAIAIAQQRPAAKLTAVDSSSSALVLARENAATFDVEVEFLQSDWFSALSGRRFDVIVANPPYVAADDPHLRQGDLRFEPRPALAAGGDGLADLCRIVAAAPEYLCPGGWLLLEHGYDQAEACRDLLRKTGFSGLVFRADIAGLPRIAGGRLLTPDSPSR
ncbi:MAG TPA: peptide chain release factor N(5)-glutamine methyltransferase [Burkholderiales bacterium]|nr:peptide chain release factor N(5)-glutamine methyltransferase [Burkholderiales bacterium]